MPALQYGLSSFERARGGLPELPVVNMFAENAPTEENGVMLQSRSGLVDRSASMGGGPVQALFRLDGVLSGDLFGVSNGHFYRNTTDLGSMTGGGPYFIDGYANRVVVSTGSKLYSYDGTTFGLTGSASATVGKVVIGGGRAVFIDTATDQFGWSQPFTQVYGGLSFATAESRPDYLRDALFLDDVLVLFGSRTVEFWPNTTDDNLPFVPLESRVFERGIRATGCACVFRSQIAWVTEINQVCVNSTDNVISYPGMEALTAASTAVRLWTFNHEGTEFLALTLDSRTFAFSGRSNMWCELQSYGKSNFWGRCFADGVFGSAFDGKTLAFGTTFEELGGRLERRFRAGLALNGGAVSMDRLSLRTDPGDTAYLSGTYVNPTAEMRVSRNAGRTWGSYRSAQLGIQGDYDKRVEWLANGVHGAPGFMAEFRVTDPVDFRVSGVYANEPFGGL